MSTTNVAIYACEGNDGYACHDGVIAQGSTQATARRIYSQFTRVIGGAANSGMVLPSVLTGEMTAGKYMVMNDGANAIKVYCTTGENHNGAGNAALSIPAGQTGVFYPVANSKGGTIDWRSAVIA